MEYSLYKLLHVLGVIIFLGNIITGLFWMRFAVSTKNVTIIAHTMKGIIAADNYFTTPGVIVITAAGIMTAIIGHFPILSTGWILWPIILFIISGGAFMAAVAPLQKKIYALTSVSEGNGDLDWDQFHRLVRAWELWGSVALLTPLAAAVIMILKMPQ
jgi:uncharacterized membrane protein